jgi:hypothetical protein
MTQETGCCPKLDPAHWDGKEHLWHNKRFIKGHVTSLFHMPLNFGSVITKLMNRIDASKARDKDPIWLSEETSLFGSDLFVSVSKEVPDAINYEISGTFVSKVFTGSYSNMGKWIASTKAFVAGKGKKIKRMLFWYATCPKCAKVYGKNHTVIFAETD